MWRCNDIPKRRIALIFIHRNGNWVGLQVWVDIHIPRTYSMIEWYPMKVSHLYWCLIFIYFWDGQTSILVALILALSQAVPKPEAKRARKSQNGDAEQQILPFYSHRPNLPFCATRLTILTLGDAKAPIWVSAPKAQNNVSTLNMIELVAMGAGRLGVLWSFFFVLFCFCLMMGVGWGGVGC